MTETAAVHTAARSLTVDVWADEDKVAAIRAAIARYRAACRQLFAVLTLARAASAEICEHEEGLRVKPHNPAAKLVLSAALGAGQVSAPQKLEKGSGVEFTLRVGAGDAYEMRDYFLRELYCGCLSFVWDSARRAVLKYWSARDPEFPRASRGWLTLQGARDLARFRYMGIEFPQASARPKLLERGVLLKWDSEIGALEFRLGKLDPRRWYTWTKVRDGAWKAGTLTLNERDGKLRVTISYHAPLCPEELDKASVLTVELAGDGQALVLAGPDGALDRVGTVDAIARLACLKEQREVWEKRRACAGSSVRAWGSRCDWRAIQRHLDAVTRNRERLAANYNHAWARRIAARALSWRCGQVKLIAPKDGMLAGHPWGWYQLGEFVRYKASEVGSSLITE